MRLLIIVPGHGWVRFNYCSCSQTRRLHESVSCASMSKASVSPIATCYKYEVHQIKSSSCRKRSIVKMLLMGLIKDMMHQQLGVPHRGAASSNSILRILQCLACGLDFWSKRLRPLMRGPPSTSPQLLVAGISWVNLSMGYIPIRKV